MRRPMAGTSRRLARASIAVALACAGARASAQGVGGDALAPAIDPQCRAETASERITQDACQKALDLFQFMAPQLGIMLVGGNAVAGEHSALRGLGHVSIGVRATGIEAALPRVDQQNPATTGAVSSRYAVRSQWLAAPALDAAIGLFRGFPFGGSHALGVDALVNVAYIPTLDDDDLSIDTPGGSVKLGAGARVGLLAETFLTPGLSLTYLRRDLPTLDLMGRVEGDVLEVRNARARTTAWRVVAGKNLSVFGVTVGGGRDRYDSSADAQVTINRVVPAVTSNLVRARQVMDRTNLFGNVALNLPALRLVAEVGRVSGGSSPGTYNSFAAAGVRDARTYASVGLRVTW